MSSSANLFGGVDYAKISITITNPVDATGNLKVSVQNQPAVTLQTDNIGLAKASQLPSSLDVSGNLKVSVQNQPLVTIQNPLDATGNVKVSVQNQPTVAVSSLPSLPAGTNNIGSVNVASLPSVTVGSPLDASGNVKASIQNQPAITIQTDNVGLAKSSQLPSALDASGNLKVSVQNQPPITLQTDNVGIAKDTTLNSILSKLTPIQKGSIFNTAIAANTNFFGTALSPTNTPTMFRIYVAMSASGILTLTRTSGATTVNEQLNGGTALTANAGYIFDVPVDSGETINLQYSVAGTILKCTVKEIDGWIA